MAKTVLMVEGKDDEHVVKHICGTRGIGEIGAIKEYGGKDTLLEAIGTRLKESDLDALGILMDADTDLVARWDSIRHRLVAAGYLDVPTVPNLGGTVVNAPERSLLPRVGVWLMPDNRLNGILEDFLTFLVPAEDPLFQHVLASIDNIPEDVRRCDFLNLPKAKIHTWLAWQSEPGKPLGQAITARYLDATLPSVDIFARWLENTFFRAADA